MADTEHGIRWWIRYVIVPLIGGGGFIALMVAYINQPNAPKPTDTLIPSERGPATAETGIEVLTPSLEERHGPATIVILVIPYRGSGPDSRGVISGKVQGIHDPSKYRVVLYALTDRWYVQPAFNEALTLINSDGSWANTTHLGSEYAAMLVASSFKPPESPNALPGGEAVLAFTRAGASISP